MATRLSAWAMTLQPEPAKNCALCPRLATFRQENSVRYPTMFNAPVPGWGDPNAWLLVAGLAPGLHGANRTGRPFTGDYAGDLLYATLLKFGLAEGVYAKKINDGLQLNGTFIANAVRCVPPENKPTPEEIKTCRPFFSDQLKSLPRVKIIIALGTIAHQSTIKALNGKLPKHSFGHNAVHHMHSGHIVIDSYHCSRYNTSTKRLTPEMFEAVFENALNLGEKLSLRER
jgi:uracil-DNA glycosylase